MRIIFVGNRLSPHVTRPLMALQQAGHKLLLLDTAMVPAADVKSLPFKSVRLPDSWEQIPDLLRTIAKTFKPDLVHVHWVDCIALYCLQADVAPLLVSVWGSDVNRPVTIDNQGLPAYADVKGDRLVDYIQLYDMLPRVAGIVVDDPVMVHKCRLLAGEDVPIYNIHLGVDPHFFRVVDPDVLRTARTNIGLDEASRLFVSARAFAPHYRHEEILDAFAKLDNDNIYLAFKLYDGRGLTTDMMGDPFNMRADASFAQIPTKADPMLEGEIRELKKYEHTLRMKAQQYGIQEKIRFINPIDTSLMPILYAMSEAVVNFPERDGFPITFAESAALGVRTITNMLPAYEHSFVPKCFDIVADDSVDALAATMKRVLETPYQISKRIAARAAASSSYRFERYMERLIEVYEKTVKIHARFTQKYDGQSQHAPQVSFLIPCYNYDRFLAECLESLKAQTVTDWEAIIVDDGSLTPAAESIVSSYKDDRFTYIRLAKNMGKGYALNRAFAKSRGRYVVIVDADDLLEATYCEKCLQAFAADPKVEVVFTDLQLFGNVTEVWHYSERGVLDMTLEQWIPGAGTMMARAVYKNTCGNYEGPELRYGNIDWDFWLAAARRSLVSKHIPESLYLYRGHGSSISDRRPRYDFITRECMLRRHAALFSLAGTDKIFVATGYLNAARQAWRAQDTARVLPLAARACQLTPQQPPDLPSIDIPTDKHDHLRSLLAMRIELEKEKALEPTEENISNRGLLSLLYAQQEDWTHACDHLKVTMKMQISLQNWTGVIESALMLAVMYMKQNAWTEVDKVLEFAHAVTPVHPDVEFLRVVSAIQRKAIVGACHIVAATLALSNLADFSLLLLGYLFLRGIEKADKHIPSLVKHFSQLNKSQTVQQIPKFTHEAILQRVHATEFGMMIR